MTEKLIIQNIKKFRMEQKITLEELAQRTGLTKGYLSRIERSKKAPPYSTLNRIAMALGIDVSLLLTEGSEELKDVRISITKKNDGKVVETIGTFYGYKYEALAQNKPGKNMVPFIIEPAFKEKGIFNHEGEEFIYVLEGKHEFTYDGKKYILEEGDSVYFDSGVPHVGISLGEKKGKLLSIMFHYKRM